MTRSVKRLSLGIVVLLVSLVLVGLPCLTSANPDNVDPIVANLASQEQLKAQLEEMRAEIKANGWKFNVGPNPALQHSLEQLCGTKPDLKPDVSSAHEPGPSGNRVPASVIQSLPYPSFTGSYSPVTDQGNCGSCWAFATVGNLEGALLKTGVTCTGPACDLSEQYVVSCNPWHWGCNGGNFAYDMLKSPWPGDMTEKYFPYVAQNAPCAYTTPTMWYAVSSWGYITSANSVPSVSAIKAAIYTYGSVSAYINADNFFQAYTGGIFTTNKKAKTTNHAIILCGWDDSQQVWLLKNSWGTGWGETAWGKGLGTKGFMRIKYNCPNLVGQGASWVLPQ